MRFDFRRPAGLRAALGHKYHRTFTEGKGAKKGAHSGDTSAYAGAPTGVAGFFAGFWGDAAQWFRKACLKRRSTGVFPRAFL